MFVDFTANWCLSCQVNERVALDRPEVTQAFADAHVALFNADWTPEDPAITQELQSWAAAACRLMRSIRRDKAPQLLPEALTPGIVIDAVHNLPQAAAAP